jgi:predicted HTH transcriptional regulator
MDYVDMSHLVGDERYHDRLTYDGRWENNVYQFMNRVIPKFTIDLPRPFRMEGIKRVDDTPQHKAVREAFTNAIIHADVFLPGGVLRIDKYDDRLVLRNPGTLRLPIEKIYEGGTSRARNPRIQNMLRMIGYGENLGSGFPMIVSAWKDAGWGEPVLKNQIELDEVELSLPVQKPMEISKNNSNENKRELSDVLKNVLKDVQKEYLEKLTERQIDVLEFIVQTPTITFKEMSKRLKVSVKTIQRDFTAMGLLGINIVRKDGKTYGEWVIKL